MRLPWIVALLGVLLCSLPAAAEELKVEVLDQPPNSKYVSQAILQQLQPRGWKLVRDGRSYMAVWLAKSWASTARSDSSGQVLYPFKPGELIGVVRLYRTTPDFRGQELRRGYYVLRYGLQPQDGDHVGTFDTRDFLVLTPAKLDRDPAPLDTEKLTELGAESAGSTHPAIFPLLSPPKQRLDAPQVQHYDEQEWTSVSFSGKTQDGKPLGLQLIVVGQAEE